jgi:mannose-6-phosphate isomerase-like protein (cupin superfamily)
MASEQAKQGIRIYRAADAPDLMASGFLSHVEPAANPEQREVGSMLGGASGADSRLLVRQKPEEGGFSLLYLFFKANYPLFRHRHDSDCLYLVISGEAILGNQTLRKGDSFFVPADAPYTYNAGPEGVEIVEIRHNVDAVTTAFTGEGQSRLDDAKERVEANAAAWKDTVAPFLQVDASVA